MTKSALFKCKTVFLQGGILFISNISMFRDYLSDSGIALVYCEVILCKVDII